MEESLLKNLESVKLSEKFEDAADISPTLKLALGDVSKFEHDTITPQSSQLKLENISKSNRQDVNYELFNTVYINHVPNYCYRVTALGLTTIGKGWSEDEAKEKCAQGLINKYANIKSNSDKPMKVQKPSKEDLDLDMTSLTVAPKINITSTRRGNQHKTSIISNNLKTKTFYSTNCQTNLSENVPVAACAESEANTGSVISTETKNELPVKTVMDIQNVKPNINTKPISKHVAQNIPSITDTHVNSALKTKSKMETKDRNNLFFSNPVKKLREISVNSKIRIPIYINCQPSGPLDGIEHIVKCSFIGHNVNGQGLTKREAKTQAAENMLRIMISFGWQIDID